MLQILSVILFRYLVLMFKSLHRFTIQIRKDQYEWLLERKVPGRSLSAHIREILDTVKKEPTTEI
jgi:hypothetical protein